MNTASTTYSKSTVHFTIDFLKKQITGTQTSFNRAGRGFGAEYNELTAKMAAHPDFALIVKDENKVVKAKRTYDGLSFSFMETYIGTLENASDMIAEYKAVKQMAEKCGTKVYPLTKKWFLSKFRTEDAPFDMEKAKEEIKQHCIQVAENCPKSNGNTLNAVCQ